MEKLVEYEIERLENIFKENKYNKEQKLLYLEAREKIAKKIKDTISLAACLKIKEKLIKE